MHKLLLLAIAVVLLAAACSSGNGASTTTTTSSASSTAATTTTTAATTSSTSSGAQLSDLTLVYIDSRKPGASELWLADHDGAKPRMLATLQQGAHSLDLKGNLLVVNAGSPAVYQVIDLSNGQTRTVTPQGTATDAKLLDASTLLYTTRSGCSGGPPTSDLMSVDLASMQQKKLFSIDSAGMNIVDIDATAGTVAVSPRGCDVSTTEVQVHRLSDGSLAGSYATPGCGWIEGSLKLQMVLSSWRGCTPPANKAGFDASLYVYSTTPLTPKDLKAPSGGSNAQPWLLRPGKAEAALGTGTTTTGPGGSSGSGVWLLDLNTQAFSPLQPAAGAEQSAIAWSADGAYLLTQSVQAQGLCSYAYVDIAAKKVTDISAEITQCGVNGQVIGWAALKP
jgi:hypothetical protein